MKRIFLIPALVAAGCVFQSLIVRDDVADEEFIELAKKYPQLCHLPMGEATLIDSSWALTAGHVGRDLKNDLEKNFSPLLRCNGSEYKISKVVVYPGFDDTPEGIINDIALIKLEKKVRGVMPAKIYSAGGEKGMAITIAGSGDIGTGLTGPQKWDKISRAATNVVDETEEQWIRFTFDPPGSPESTRLEGISGPGDSGGPAFYENKDGLYIIGVSSHQKSKNGKGRYGATEYYSRVSAYHAWITKTINDHQ